MNSEQTSQKRILLVEDDAIISIYMEHFLETAGYQVADVLAFGEMVLDIVRTQPPDLILMDIKLAGAMNGIEAAALVQAEFDIPVIFLTAYNADSLIDQVKRTNPGRWLYKPVSDTKLQKIIEATLREHQQKSLGENQDGAG